MYFIFFAPQDSITYVLRKECAPMFRDAQIEFRVGNESGDIGWWSDSAFAKPKGREYDGIQ
jgi:hypothetical protein